MVFQHKHQGSLSPYGHILTSTKSSFIANNCISFFHICRIGNIVTYNLAKHARHARHVKGLSVRMEDILQNLVFVLFTNHD